MKLPPTTTQYDVMDRTLSVTTPDQLTSYTAYGFGNDGSKIRFKTTQTDALSKITQLFTDARGLKTNIIDALNGTTKFNYNALGELLSSTDPENNTTYHEYDMLGRRIQRIHPDAGTTNYTYDPAGNVTAMQTQNLIDQSQEIQYTYDYNRLTGISYPQNPENNVFYEYGNPGTGNEAGRITRQQDASGVQEFYYGKMGELTRNIHTFVMPQGPTYTFEMQWNYDSWNRVKDITYPDGEVVNYGYNNGGQLKEMEGNKNGQNFRYINNIGYDKYEKRLHVQYGNDVTANYTYNPLTLQLSNLTSMNAMGEVMQNIDYTYDNVSNITGISNVALPFSNGMGGDYNYNYSYDNLYRLETSNGVFNDQYYSLEMQYTPSGNISRKYLDGITNINGDFKPVNYDRTYNYESSSQPHTLRNFEIEGGNADFQWDANGNLILFEKNGEEQLSRRHCWDEENRLSAVADQSFISHYIYDAAGERVWKQSGAMQQMLINDYQTVNFADINNTTLYANPYMVVNDHEYTKHYYTEGQRICSKLGGGMQNNLIGIHNEITPIDNAYENLVENALEKMNRDFECVEIIPEYNPENFRNFVNDIEGRDDQENDLFYYHSDHLGSSSFITDLNGNPTQHLQYLPFGESFVEQQSGAPYNTAYKFSGKEMDEETGYSYFGARYYMSDISIWNSVDPMADKYQSMSPYLYCAGNPVMLVDPDGREFDDPPYTHQYSGFLVGMFLEKFGYFSTVKQGGYLMGNTANALYIKNNLNVVATNFQVNIGRSIGSRDNVPGSPQNAIRHTLWNALMARDLGGEQAPRAANSHETGWDLNSSQRSFSFTKNNDNSFAKASEQADNVADLLNNEIGRAIGLTNPSDDNKTLAGKVMKEYYTNGLYTTTTNNGNVEVVKTRITKAQYDAAIKEINIKGNNGLNE